MSVTVDRHTLPSPSIAQRGYEGREPAQHAHRGDAPAGGPLAQALRGLGVAGSSGTVLDTGWTLQAYP
jgi:hypothetical protein